VPGPNDTAIFDKDASLMQDFFIGPGQILVGNGASVGLYALSHAGTDVVSANDVWLVPGTTMAVSDLFRADILLVGPAATFDGPTNTRDVPSTLSQLTNDATFNFTASNASPSYRQHIPFAFRDCYPPDGG
jgi:hypothetical protein